MNVETPSPVKSAAPLPEGSFVPHQPTFKQKVIARIIYTVIRTISATLRYRWERDPRTLPQEGRPYIFCMWHNRLPLSLIMYRQYVRASGKPFRLAAIVSASRDGAVLTRVLELFQVRPARGSSSRRGAQVLLELASCAEQGFDLAFAPDGPRGPLYEMKPGVITLSSMTGRPLVPASYHLSTKITLGSWDRFQIPLPFSKCTFRFADPVSVPRDSAEEERERIRQQFQTTLKALTED